MSELPDPEEPLTAVSLLSTRPAASTPPIGVITISVVMTYKLTDRRTRIRELP